MIVDFKVFQLPSQIFSKQEITAPPREKLALLQYAAQVAKHPQRPPLQEALLKVANFLHLFAPPFPPPRPPLLLTRVPFSLIDLSEHFRRSCRLGLSGHPH